MWKIWEERDKLRMEGEPGDWIPRNILKTYGIPVKSRSAQIMFSYTLLNLFLKYHFRL